MQQNVIMQSLKSWVQSRDFIVQSLLEFVVFYSLMVIGKKLILNTDIAVFNLLFFLPDPLFLDVRVAKPGHDTSSQYALHHTYVEV